jgi:putative heme iron utilization protein
MVEKIPFRDLTPEARNLARSLVNDSTSAALSFLRADGGPSVTRIALATDAVGMPVSLVSDLASHTQALRANAACALLIGEPGDRGDPLTHPRLTLHCQAHFVDRTSPKYADLRAHYLALRPKAKLYVDFGDFHFLRFEVRDGLLNAGFGKAYRLGLGELTDPA